ncbi:CD40 ligand [Pempheris klunzingeri]|uniref:CD40 ligand n=1 Tax=Pempheris klunzingeri TaxID=3127111 RepID=UPI0039817AFE
MINTYQTSLAPPPVPPRLNRSHPVLIPGQLPSQGHSKSVIWFLVGVALLHLFLSVGAFIFLYQRGTLENSSAAEGKVAAHSSGKQETSYRALARMVVARPRQPTQKSTSGYFQWDVGHSIHRNVNYYQKSWLTILESGDYYVYSRVTFSRGDSVRPLAAIVKLKKNESGEEKTVMQAFCHLDSHSGSASIPHLCTAMQGDVMTLEKGNLLSVWVQDLSLVNYDEGATTFGMYKL